MIHKKSAGIHTCNVDNNLTASKQTHQTSSKNSIQASLSCHTREETHTDLLSCTDLSASAYTPLSFHLWYV